MRRGLPRGLPPGLPPGPPTGLSLGAALALAPGFALACLNDFEIALAEQQLRGAYAPEISPSTPLPLTEIAAAAGAIALIVALVRAARAA